MNATTAVRVMPARFASSCGSCGGAIRKGADIRYVKGFAANHEGCGDPSTLSSSMPAAKSSRSGYGRSTWVARCTHEDYPCCGCGS